VSDQIDMHLGARLRGLRELRGMSLTAIGREIGTTYQQVRKYESGQNRISASTLYRLASLLSVDIAYFYQGLPQTSAEAASTSASAPREGALSSILERVGDEDVRRHLEGLLQALGGR
jgi:transcriptional regulator with XRE-family HTH domain